MTVRRLLRPRTREVARSALRLERAALDMADALDHLEQTPIEERDTWLLVSVTTLTFRLAERLQTIHHEAEQTGRFEGLQRPPIALTAKRGAA